MTMTQIVFEPVDMAAVKMKKLMFYATGKYRQRVHFFSIFIRRNSCFGAS